MTAEDITPEEAEALRRVEAARRAHGLPPGPPPVRRPLPLPLPAQAETPPHARPLSLSLPLPAQAEHAARPLPLPAQAEHAARPLPLPAQAETPHAAALADARLFFEALFSVRTPGEIMVTHAASDGWRNTWHSKPEDAARSAIESADTCDVYFGVGRRIERHQKGEPVVQLGFVWGDVDCETGADLDAFIARVTEAQLPPSMAVQTSESGLHCYWLLKDARESADVTSVVAQLAARFRTDPSVSDDARILRVPGTRNCKQKPGRHGFRVRFFSAGGRWWCPEDGLAQMPRYALEDLGTPHVRARGSAVAWHPAEPMHELLRALERDVPDARRTAYRGSEKVALRCLFHPDTKPSAVVFANGWFFCSACAVSEPASKWTRRSAAKRWSELVRAERDRRRQETAQVGIGRYGFFRAPRVGIRDVGRALLRDPSSMRSKLWIDAPPGHQMRLGAQRSEGALEPVAFYMVCEELRADLPMAYRALWASIVLAQMADQGGWFPLTMPLVGRLLGYSMSNGELNDGPRRAIREALHLLTRIGADIRWSDETGSSRARLLTPLSEEKRGPLVYSTFALHPGIHKQVVGRSQAYGHLRPEALKLEPERLAVYLLGRFEHRQRGGRAELRLPLTSIAQRAGVPLDLSTERARQLRRWAAAYDKYPGLGLQVDVSSAELVVGVQAPVTVDDLAPMQRAMQRAMLAAPPLPEWPRLVAEGGGDGE